MPVSARSATPSRGRLRESALVLAFAVFALLWLIVAPYRRVYVPRADDVTALADGLLLLPNARWTD